MSQIASAIDKVCSSDPVNVSADKISAGLSELDGLDESELLIVYNVLTQNKRKI